MLTLLGDHKPCFIFKQIFLRQLPEKLRVPLANSPHKTDLRPEAGETTHDKDFPQRFEPGTNEVKKRGQ